MTAPARIVYGPRNVYRLDPYVRDAGGRFAPAPVETPAPIAVLTDAADSTVRYLHGGAMIVCDDVTNRNHWRVRTVLDDDGSYRVIYLQD